MGGGRSGSSSRPKSLKKKRKRSRSEKKSRRNESKKRRHDSVSSDPIGDLSDSQRPEKSSRSKSSFKIRKRKHRKHPGDCSDSDDRLISSGSVSFVDKEQRRRKSRKVYGRSKSTKKAARKRESSVSSDSDEYNARKRKRLDVDHAIKKRKKSLKKNTKRYKRDSLNSSSESFSTSPTRSRKYNSSAEDGYTKRRRRTDDNLELPIKTEPCMSPSCSSLEKHSDRDVGVTLYDTAIPSGANSRRLRSIIAVSEQPRNEMERRLEKDSHKEEIVYDQEDDYPSSRSMDSDEDYSRKDFGRVNNASHGISPVNDSNQDMENCITTGSVEEDTESILRQRALEKFRKYKADSEKCHNSPEKRQRANSIVKSDAKELPCSEHIINDSVMSQQRVENQMNAPSLPASSDPGPGMTETSSVAQEHNNKQKDASQFKQKTMSVMRGGEMVEVSYKVYIPTKSPALARRQLKR